LAGEDEDDAAWIRSGSRGDGGVRLPMCYSVELVKKLRAARRGSRRAMFHCRTASHQRESDIGGFQLVMVSQVTSQPPRLFPQGRLTSG
jgi:hypothetical protein